MWPAVAYHYAMILTRYRIALDRCFRRLDALLEELKASEQQTQF
jgi:hypothetical protein